MKNQKWTVAVFALGVIVGAVVATLLVSAKWRRDFESMHAAEVAGQAHVAYMVYSGRSEELAEGILSQLPTYVSEIDRDFSRPPAIRLVASWTTSAYEASGREMPGSIEEILTRWTRARH